MQKPNTSTRKANGKWVGQASRHERGYGAAWDKLRKIIIKRDMALCQPCLTKGRPTPFTQVDHITPKAKGGTDEHDNLQCICTPCHSDKTQREAAEAQGRQAKDRLTFTADGQVIW